MPLKEIGGKGLFIKELEAAMMEGMRILLFIPSKTCQYNYLVG